jgi:hypothetical protein
MKKHSVHSLLLKDASIPGRSPRTIQEPPPQTRIAQVITEAASDIAVLLRQEVTQFATLKSLVVLSLAAIGACLMVFFASLALLAWLAASMPLYWAALILSGIWAFISILALAYFRAQVRRFMIDRDESHPPD